MSVPEWIAKWESQESKSVAPRLSKEEVLLILQKSPDSVTVVDLRNDRDNGFITQAAHIPATEIDGPSDIGPKLVDPIVAAKPSTELIVIHCNSSARRASYVAGWATDYTSKTSGPAVRILDQGIVGWLQGGTEFQPETTRP